MTHVPMPSATCISHVLLLVALIPASNKSNEQMSHFTDRPIVYEEWGREPYKFFLFDPFSTRWHQHLTDSKMRSVYMSKLTTRNRLAD